MVWIINGNTMEYNMIEYVDEANILIHAGMDILVWYMYKPTIPN